jgi:hypothetical protein
MQRAVAKTDTQFAQYLVKKATDADTAMNEVGATEENCLKKVLKADLQEIQEWMDKNKVFAESIPGIVEAAKAARRKELDTSLEEARERVARHKAKAEDDYSMLLEYGRKNVPLDNEPDTHDRDTLRADRKRLRMA